MIICDDREPENIRKDLDCVVRRLEIGNYIVGDLLIVRKIPSDFFDSLCDRHFWILIQDLMNIDDYISCIVIIGDVREELTKRNIQGGYDILFNLFKIISGLSTISILQFGNQNYFEDFLKICNDEKQGVSIDFLVRKTRCFLFSKSMDSLISP